MAEGWTFQQSLSEPIASLEDLSRACAAQLRTLNLWGYPIDVRVADYSSSSVTLQFREEREVVGDVRISLWYHNGHTPPRRFVSEITITIAEGKRNQGYGTTIFPIVLAILENMPQIDDIVFSVEKGNAFMLSVTEHITGYRVSETHYTDDVPRFRFHKKCK